MDIRSWPHNNMNEMTLKGRPGQIRAASTGLSFTTSMAATAYLSSGFVGSLENFQIVDIVLTMGRV